MDDLLMLLIVAAIVMCAFTLLAVDFSITRVCPDCGSTCRRDKSAASIQGVSFYRCTSCQIPLLGRKPRR